ncbi:glycosyltransferase family 69 protein [Bacteroidia bacterium]|nr:glycosyltransferase family 69 protein [Bacteroidia bacterium]
MKVSRVIVAGLAYNCSEVILQNIRIVKDFVAQFDEAAIIVVENGSNDGTKEILKSRDDIDYLEVDDIIDANSYADKSPFGKDRISKLALLRNQYLEKIDEYNWQEAYVIIIDWDLKSFTKNTLNILYSKSIRKYGYVISANGYSFYFGFLKLYHDTFAVKSKFYYSHSLLGLYFLKLTVSGLLLGFQELRVRSAFGGIAVYQPNQLNGAKYKALPHNKGLLSFQCEHVALHEDIRKNEQMKGVLICGSAKLRYQ